jgi:hypothetical protein
VHLGNALEGNAMTKSRRGTMSWRPVGCAVRLRQAAAASALAISAAMVLGPSAARAQDASGDESTTIWNFDKKVSDKVLKTLGLKGSPSIDYRERSPLVVPPTLDLPPPQQKSVKAQLPANWPVDASPTASTKSAPKAAPKTTTADQNWAGFMDNSQSPGRAAGATVSPGTVTDPDASEKPLKPSDLNYSGNIFTNLFKHNTDTEYGTFTGEAPRTSLVEPPVGYQTPSPNQPYGVTKRVDYGKAAKPDQAGGDALPK